MAIKYTISRIANEKSKYRIFLSHSNKNDKWLEIKDLLTKNNIDIASDQGIDPGSPDFAQVIKEMIKKNEVVVVFLDQYTFSSWVGYELGLAAGLQKKIFLYSSEPFAEGNNKKYYIEQFGPIINDPYELIDRIKTSFFFADLFEYETSKLKKETFLNACVSNIDICEISFNIFGIGDIPLDAYQFGYILLSLSRYEKLESDRSDKICGMTAGEIENGCCYLDGMPCSLCEKQVFSGATDTILNKLLYKSRVDHAAQTLSFILPFNEKRGVTFKCFVDIYDMDYLDDFVLLLKNAGVQDLGVSHSAAGNRVYFMLPKSVRNGLFSVEAPDGFFNNYICKGAII